MPMAPASWALLLSLLSMSEVIRCSTQGSVSFEMHNGHAYARPRCIALQCDIVRQVCEQVLERCRDEIVLAYASLLLPSGALGDFELAYTAIPVHRLQEHLECAHQVEPGHSEQNAPGVGPSNTSLYRLSRSLKT
jgi:hypothetical protein